MANGLNDIKIYTEGMRKSLLDKIFFMDKINSEMFIDFGCADGAMLNFLQNMFPEYTYAGYDNSPEMLELAKKICSEKIAFTGSWDFVKGMVDTGKSSTLILSSVLHEVYSYLNPVEIGDFYSKVFKTGFDYIVIRDMMVSKTADRHSNINDVVKVYRHNGLSHLNDFENKWGSIDNNENLIHYLLKYRYWENWEREVKENYLPINFENLLSVIPSDYEVIFCEHYCLPFLKEVVKKDFGIELVDNTHAKFILRRIK